MLFLWYFVFLFSSLCVYYFLYIIFTVCTGRSLNLISEMWYQAPWVIHFWHSFVKGLHKGVFANNNNNRIFDPNKTLGSLVFSGFVGRPGNLKKVEKVPALQTEYSGAAQGMLHEKNICKASLLRRGVGCTAWLSSASVQKLYKSFCSKAILRLTKKWWLIGKLCPF